MMKRKRIIIGVLFIALAFAAIVGIRTAFNKPTNVAEVSKNETIAPTKDGKQCTPTEKMDTKYGVAVVDKSATSQTISVDNGKFRVQGTSVKDGNEDDSDYIGSVSDAISTSLDGVVITPDSPLKVEVKNVNAIVTVNLVLAETDDTCLSYDEATTDDTGQKVGTYQVAVELDINPVKEVRDPVLNEQYDRLCKVFRTGEGYSDYASILKKAHVSEDMIKQYNYNAVSDELKGTYDTIIDYCLNERVAFNYEDETAAKLIYSAIEHVKEIENTQPDYVPDSQFLADFNYAKKQALATGHDFSQYIKKNTDSKKPGSIEKTEKLTCEVPMSKDGVDTSESSGGYYKPENTKYYYAKEESEEKVTYKYTYTSGNTKSESANVCSKVCEESVVVEYGPPVVSKAGLCFEYRVRVTSRVVCDSYVKSSPPTKPGVCSPTPFCNYIPGLTHQGGPNQSFDSCVQNCDGGKYSDACSKQCYEEVYGDDNTTTDPLAAKTATARAAQMDYIPFPGYAGEYTMNKNGYIGWSNKGNTYGRWYKENEDARTRAEHDYYNQAGAGFYLPGREGYKLQHYTSGLCQDPCYWSGCSTYSYLNDSEAARDYLNNLNAYNAAIAKCEASASCSTRTSTFTIGASYVDGEGKTQKVTFPLSTGKANVKTPGNGGNGENLNESIFVPSDLTLGENGDYGYTGCYKESSAKDRYQAAWSFPGTWINNKTGEISFKPITDGAWTEKEDKFCIPLDAQSVNTKWWEKIVLDSDCYTESQIKAEVAGNQNIFASTREFGYFGWDFDISCFYALKNETYELDENDKLICEDSTCVGDECDETGFDDYTFRVVDLGNLFPAQKNETDANKVKLDSETANSLNLGRQPGYNWTMGSKNMSDASLLENSMSNKNDGYIVNPLAYIQKVQSEGNRIYNDNYLDYRIQLDNQALREIREFNKGKSYSDFDDGSIKQSSDSEDNTFTYYHSNLLDRLGGAVLERGTPGVNNEGR